MTEVRTYPGMITPEIEMFVVENELKVIQNGKVSSFVDLPYPVFQILREAVAADPEAQRHLKMMHPGSEYRRIEQFAMCRFGGLDFKGDISEAGELQDGEYWDCPMRGKCQSEGILCKLPVIEGHRLTSEEIKLIKLSTTDKTNEAIADELGLPMGTFHKNKKTIYDNFKIATKQCLTKLALSLNII